MAQDLVSLYNLALSAIGHRARVSHQDEESRESELCNQWYPIVRDQVLKAAKWPSCRAVAMLTLEAERDFSVDWAEGDPEPPWTFSYHLPQDFLYPRFLDTYQNFELSQVGGARTLLSHAETPILTYTKRQTAQAHWDVDLYMAVALALAGHIAQPLHGKPGMAQKAMMDADQKIMIARLNEANSNMSEKDSIPDWLLARGVTVGTSQSRFIYQNGPLFYSGALT